MDVRARVLAPCAVLHLDTDVVEVDRAAFLRNLLLFDTHVVQSFGLREVPQLVDAVGYQGLRKLLNEGAVQFHPFRLFAGNLDRSPRGQKSGEMTYNLSFDGTVVPTRPGHYELVNAYVGQPTEELERYLASFRGISSLTRTQQNRLSDAVRRQLVRIPDAYGSESTDQIHLDLNRGLTGLRRAAAQYLSAALRAGVPEDQVELRLHRESEVAFFLESNLESRFGLTPLDAHTLLGNALLGLSRLNVRLEDMKMSRAVSGTTLDEYPYLEEKFDWLRRELDPTAQLERFHRVLNLAGLEDISSDMAAGGRVNFERFLEVRASDECREFRAWLRTSDEDSDAELRARIESIRTKFGHASQSKIGRGARLATTTGLGLVPLAGPLLGAAASALDTFVVDRLLKDDGPVAFLTRMYPSIFVH